LDTSLIKYASFLNELEKTAGIRSSIFKKLVNKFPKLLDFGNKFKSYAKAGASSERAFAPKFFNKGTVASAGKDAMKGELGKITHKPTLGFKPKEAIGFREVTPNANHGLKWYQKNPGEWGKSVLKSQADRFDYAKKHGIFKTIGKQISEARHYTKEFKGADGKLYQGKFKRSVAGQALGVAGGTGVAFGGLEYMNKEDEQGNPLTKGKRALNAAAEVGKWTVAEPLMMAKMTLYDLPKMGLDLIKPKKSNNSGF